MSEDDLEPNIDWEQAKGFSKNTRASRRIDVKKAMTVDALSKNNFNKNTNPVKKIAPNLKKIQSKIRDVYDDEDDEEDEKQAVVFDFNFDDMSSSLYTALSDEERTRINATKGVETHKLQQMTEKNTGILLANKMSRELGLKEMDKEIVTNTTKDVTFDDKTFEKTLLENVSSQTKLKTDGLTYKESKDMIRGLNKIKQAELLSNEISLGKLTEQMESNDIINIGKEKNTAKTAKMIIEKTGRTDEKIKKIEKNLNKVKAR